MTPDKRYEIICNMLFDYDRATDNRAAEMVIKNPQEFAKACFIPFYANAAQLLIDCQKEIDGKTTGKAKTSAVNRIYKDCAKEYNRALHGMYETTENGKPLYFLCDGHMIIGFYEDFASIPRVNDADKMPEKNLVKYLTYEDAEKVFIDLPTTAAIKAEKATNTAKYGRKEKKPVHLAEKILVSPDTVLNIMQALPNCKAWTNGKVNAPIYFEAENGKAMLLPCRYYETATA